MDGRRSSVKEFIGLQEKTDIQMHTSYKSSLWGGWDCQICFQEVSGSICLILLNYKKGKDRIKTRFDYRGPAFESQAWLSGKQMTFIAEMHRVSWTVVSSALLNPGFNRLGGLSLPFNWTSSSNFSSKFEPFFIRQILIALWGEPTTSLPPPEAWTQLDLPTSRQWQVAGV